MKRSITREAPTRRRYCIKVKRLMTEHIKVEILSRLSEPDTSGTHRVGFDSAADQITLTAYGSVARRLRAGALLAARWVVGRKGIYEFSAVIDELMRS